jgi:hypothetical protein
MEGQWWYWDSGGIGTVWVYIVALNCALVNGQDGQCYVFFANKQLSKVIALPSVLHGVPSH